ncbi:hypothetical protein CBR_g6658 [Chara braunii]|uniref:Uncharacterized protein n=1 Tax=Chara braunii TaxID=69332 RepID=A0A388KKE5_CHABU|nr:hypothetical protein CBR_g6658 [Chara braunii]|eukprot:GBG70530.1 hypothetical protein CBR_g6658 [Chara braunii]
MAELHKYLHAAVPTPVMDDGVVVVDLREYIAKMDHEYAMQLYDDIDGPLLYIRIQIGKATCSALIDCEHLCNSTSPPVNCILKPQGVVRLPVCNGVADKQPCHMVILVHVPVSSVTMTLKTDTVERTIATFLGSKEVQEASIELVKQGEMSIWFTNSAADVIVKRIDFIAPSIFHMLNPGDQVLLIQITHSDKKGVFFAASWQQSMDVYWLLRCGGSCPQNLTVNGWDVFQYQRRDVENGNITYIGRSRTRSNGTSVELPEGDWGAYQMVFLNTCGSASCDLCMDLNPAATLFMKVFGLLLNDTADDFNPCFLSPVLQSTKCEISNYTGGQCLRLSELNMSSLNISISLSSPLQPIRSLEKL